MNARVKDFEGITEGLLNLPPLQVSGQPVCIGMTNNRSDIWLNWLTSHLHALSFVSMSIKAARSGKVNYHVSDIFFWQMRVLKAWRRVAGENLSLV